MHVEFNHNSTVIGCAPLADVFSTWERVLCPIPCSGRCAKLKALYVEAAYHTTGSYKYFSA